MVRQRPPCISVRGETYDQLRTYARKTGVKLTDLVTEWIEADLDERFCSSPLCSVAPVPHLRTASCPKKNYLTLDQLVSEVVRETK